MSPFPQRVNPTWFLHRSFKTWSSLTSLVTACCQRNHFLALRPRLQWIVIETLPTSYAVSQHLFFPCFPSDSIMIRAFSSKFHRRPPWLRWVFLVRAPLRSWLGRGVAWWSPESNDLVDGKRGAGFLLVRRFPLFFRCSRARRRRPSGGR